MVIIDVTVWLIEPGEPSVELFATMKSAGRRFLGVEYKEPAAPEEPTTPEDTDNSEALQQHITGLKTELTTERAAHQTDIQRADNAERKIQAIIGIATGT